MTTFNMQKKNAGILRLHNYSYHVRLHSAVSCFSTYHLKLIVYFCWCTYTHVLMLAPDCKFDTIYVFDIWQALVMFFLRCKDQYSRLTEYMKSKLLKGEANSLRH